MKHGTHSVGRRRKYAFPLLSRKRATQCCGRITVLPPPFGGLDIMVLETRRLLRCAPGFMLSPPSGA